MFPYRDENPTERFPFVTILLIVVNVIVWLFYQRGGFDDVAMARALCNWGVIPGELTGLAVGQVLPITPGMVCVVDPVPDYRTVFTMMFLHGDWLHIIGNMLFLWVFGNNIEDSMGHGRFAVFYTLCGAIASAAQVMSDPASPVPAIGASGAISGVLGAYLLLYPRARIWMVIPFFFIFFRFPLPAWAFLIYWGFIQFSSGLAQLATQQAGGATGGVAFWAHIGGYVAGMGLIFLFVDERFRRRRRRMKRARRNPSGW